MKAVIYRGTRRIAIEERLPPRITVDDEVAVEPLLVGLCGTDRGIYLGRYQGRPGVTLGHEAVAAVATAASSRSQLRPGQRVVLDPTQWCGRCDQCRAGKTRFCERKGELEIGIAQDGALAEQLVVRADALQPIPDSMPTERAVLIEPLACVMNACAMARLRSRDRVAVIGAGPLGLLWALVAARAARSVHVLETDGYRRQFASDLLGEAAILEASGRRAADVVVDTTGRGVEAAIELAADAARVVLMGCDITAVACVAPFVLTARGLTVIGAADYDAHMFRRAVRLARTLTCERLVTHRFALDEIGLALDHLSPDGGGYRAVKVVIRPQTTGSHT